MKQARPEYRLKEIQTAAKAGNISFYGRSQLDAANLNYTDEQVADCLCQLTEDNYVKTEDYSTPQGGKSFKCDVYSLTCRSPDGAQDELYIKLKYRIWVLVVSFHRHR